MTYGTMNLMVGAESLLMLIDGHALVHRAWHAIREPLTVASTGEEVRAVYGFLNTLLANLREWEPTHCAIAFDLPAPTFRHLRYPDYKAHRPPTPPELRAQFRRVRQLVEAFRIPVYEVEGYEADDALGTLCRQAEQQGVSVVILTGDTDTLQLVSPLARVSMSGGPRGNSVYDIDAVKKRYGGVGPDGVADVKALQGDTSDNIPGVPGVGLKTATALVAKFGGVEEIISRIDEVTPPRAQRNIRDGAEQLRESKALATIVLDAPVELDLDAARFWQFSRAEVEALLDEVEFVSMKSRIPTPPPTPQTGQQEAFPVEQDAEDTDYAVVDTVEALRELAQALDTPDGFAFDTETTSTDPMAADLVGLSFSTTPREGWYVPVGHVEGEQLPMQEVLDALRPVLTSECIPKYAHNANYDLTVLANCRVDVRNVAFDTMIAAALLGKPNVGLKHLALGELGLEMTELKELIGSGRKQITMAEVSIERAAAYAAADADITLRLRGRFRQPLADTDSTRAMEEVELPLIPTLTRMQMSGVSVDVEALMRMSEELGGEMERIRGELHQAAGHAFNLNSSQQLSDVLFNQFGLPKTAKRQRGFATDAASLEGLKSQLDAGRVDNVDPAAKVALEGILAYRQVSKIKSTYTDSLPGLVNPRTGRIHTSYNQVGSATGRVSSNNPNIQNIPVRTELGNRVRGAFVARGWPRWTLLGADYSQIELRILAHISRDAGLLQAFRDGQDIHASTASSVYGVPLDKVDADMRRIAKIMNFGVAYGISSFGISNQTGFTVDEGAAFIKSYFGKYPGIQEYMDDTKVFARSHGYVETLMGRRRYLPRIEARAYLARQAEERVAINTPIQGTAADVIKLAMIKIQSRMDAARLRSLMIIQVHDELIFETPTEEVEEMRGIILDVMPRAMELAVPLEVEMKQGPNWGDMR